MSDTCTYNVHVLVAPNNFHRIPFALFWFSCSSFLWPNVL